MYNRFGAFAVAIADLLRRSRLLKASSRDGFRPQRE
jgi:hypothetical protein